MKTHLEIPEFKNATAVAIGTFDGCHLGHQSVIQSMLQEAKARQLNSVVLSFQNHPLSVLAPERMPALLSSCTEKEIALNRLAPDAAVLLNFDQSFSELSPEAFVEEILVKKLQAKHVTVGFNFHFGHQAQGTPERLKQLGQQYGFEVSIHPPYELEGKVINSSRIRQHLQNGQLSESAQLLGDGYLIAGQVIRGQGIASTVLGVPTANLALETPGKLLPPHGVYVCKVKIPGQATDFSGVLNLGMRPTFDGLNLSLEVFVLNFSGDLYGQWLEVRLLHFIRPEKRFNGPEELKTQIQADIVQARQFLEMPA
ncbi:hypothetical protein COW36_02650 [bacterium (Candidatus Blackallbacteria) CG17_big_fil_post_rev_8_21_14_2_50_48_46]|uniref:Riboflavin biosynthesis protein n=1 Tax=bacterium (Candidatus Blackallbacteria) CG17_big_fil_post_rev_8_21_14_2_50_48_46 TaxID=2014261 RepID=A0A2M7GA61_9BACT|nr:MAG: hypothetical protein COW64_12820 [bacterium (Candidatus Blackallbacteria) CG18_big_fil_WC_8_21_14_2_50_49_26]PIW19028.1 MAG: hypothetical protein COW36_02650 [bacterium (Candidatus Blackallbacteria) CG17_big_fil_post_rev_8_21_14_2_50_48_46]PIW44604.1 MAG: hypothetical protein COW20_23465 [bacterium (Candidatus Blackallbacteria) CG13_big_fil_rev_8_21_14_2_50_49_14]